MLNTSNPKISLEALFFTECTCSSRTIVLEESDPGHVNVCHRALQHVELARALLQAAHPKKNALTRKLSNLLYHLKGPLGLYLFFESFETLDRCDKRLFGCTDDVGNRPHPLPRCMATSAVLAPCPLARSFATEVTPEDTNVALRPLILAAYQALPFKGRPIVLASGVCVAQDSWAAALELELDWSAACGDGSLAAFDLEAWLQERVALDGTDAQRANFQAFIAQLDAPSDSGIPTDISAIFPNFTREVVCRRMDGLPDVIKDNEYEDGDVDDVRED